MKLSNVLDHKKRYVVAVSFGPDSMALLNMLILDKFDIVVAHVNYHKRPESNFEEESLRKFCADKNIEIEVLDTAGLKPIKNFQNWARKVRYEFFKNIAEKVGADAVLVAHQEDDLLETFAMQKMRKNYVKYWGIAEITTIFDIKVIRPLLSFSKQMLKDYCDLNEVPYSIDTSNLKNDYDRNVVRHTLIENMSDQNRNELLSEISSLNSNKKSFQFSDSISLDKYLNFNEFEVIEFISQYLNKHGEHKDISSKFVTELKKAFESKKSFVEIRLTKKSNISKDYDNVVLTNKDDEFDYGVLLDSPFGFSNELFDIDFTCGAEDRNIKNNSYPITIKPVKATDFYKVKDYNCQVRRLFIDWKLPHYLRCVWPGIYDKDDKLIYVPRFRQEFKDNHKSKFVIKFAKRV